MAFATNATFLRGWLVGFHVLLAIYCAAIGALVLERPCHQVCEVRRSELSTLEVAALAFHSAFAVAALLSAGGFIAGSSRFMRSSRVTLALFTASYLVLGVWALVAVNESPLIGVLTLVISALVLAFGLVPSRVYTRMLQRQLAVAPEDTFHSHVRLIYTDLDFKRIFWQKRASGKDASTKTTKRAKLDQSLVLADVVHVVRGMKTDVLKRTGDVAKYERYLSLVADDRTLDMELPDDATCDFLVRGFDVLLHSGQ